MLDISGDARPSARSGDGPPLDFQAHLAALEAQGLLVRVERPINKDTELHPLVRWQFQGGLAEDAAPRLPVHQRGRLAAAAVTTFRSWSARWRPRRASMPSAWADRSRRSSAAWLDAIAHPIAPVAVAGAAVPGGRDQGRRAARAGQGLGSGCRCRSRRPASMPRPISPPRSASPSDPETGIQNMGTYRAALKATDRLGVRMASRIGGAGGYLHWQKHHKRSTPMPCAIVIGCAPVVVFTGAAEACRSTSTRWRSPAALAGEPIRIGEGRHRRPRRAGRRRDRDRRPDRSRAARAGRPVRREPRPRRARGLQHVDAGDRDHPQAARRCSPRSSAR